MIMIEILKASIDLITLGLSRCWYIVTRFTDAFKSTTKIFLIKKLLLLLLNYSFIKHSFWGFESVKVETYHSKRFI